jgi:hypothetical protein
MHAQREGVKGVSGVQEYPVYPVAPLLEAVLEEFALGDDWNNLFAYELNCYCRVFPLLVWRFESVFIGFRGTSEYRSRFFGEYSLTLGSYMHQE